MAGKSKLERSGKRIERWFDNENQRIFRFTELRSAFALNKKNTWRLAEKDAFEDFTDYLVRYSKLRRHQFNFPNQEFVIYSWGDDVSIFEIVLALGSGAYLSHFSAAYIHELTEQVPKTIYVTVPQPRKRSEVVILTQDQIDSAFTKPDRVTNAVATFQKYRVARLTGMDSYGLGVVEAQESGGGAVLVTNLERTLIDMVVRPLYSGGISQVLEAFRIARGKISANKLVSILRQMDFIYPYHQAIGFYMQRAGYPQSSLRLMRRIELKNNFYLAHGMQDMDFDAEWRLFFPKGF